MKPGSGWRWTRLLAAGCLLSVVALGVTPRRVWAQTEEPIAYIGHGAFFDRDGKQIPLTQTFISKAQAWYRQAMLSGLDGQQKRDFEAFERGLYEAVPAHGQERPIAQQRALDWLLSNSPQRKNDDRLQGKLRAMQVALARPLPE